MSVGQRLPGQKSTGQGVVIEECINISEDRDAPVWKRIPQEEAAGGMVPYHGARHENIQSIIVVGLIPGAIGVGRKRRDTYITMEDPEGSRNPMSGLRGGVDTVLVVAAKECIKAAVNSLANPSGTMLARGGHHSSTHGQHHIDGWLPDLHECLRAHMVGHIEHQPSTPKRSQRAIREHC